MSYILDLYKVLIRNASPRELTDEEVEEYAVRMVNDDVEMIKMIENRIKEMGGLKC
jgi:hypothetical protein